MWNERLSWWRGKVAFRVTVADAGRFLSLCRETGVGVRRTRFVEDTLFGECPAKQYRRIRTAARKAGVRPRVIGRRGFPFWYRSHRLRPGLAVGLLVYAALMGWLSRFVWVVEVHGCEQMDPQEVAAAVADMGVRVGAPIGGVDSAVVQLRSLGRLPALSWVAVNMEGCVAHVQVAERKLPAKERLGRTPANVVAAVDGEILSMTVLEGEAVAGVGDGVVAGGLLVSGVRQTEFGEYLTRAAAEVIARTTRRVTVTVPLRGERAEPTGRVTVQPTVYLFHLAIPWFVPDTAPARYRPVMREGWLRGVCHTLPFGVRREYRIEQEVRPFERTPDEALALAYNKLDEAEQSLTEGKRLLTRHEAVAYTADAVTVTVTAECVENIAVQMNLTPDF